MQRFLLVLVVCVSCLATGWVDDAQAASLSVGAGSVDPEGLRRAPWFTCNLRWKLNDQLLIEPEAGYWDRSTELTPDVTSSVRDVNLGLNLVHPIDGERVDFFVGAGFGVHLLESSATIHGTDTETDRELKDALHLLAGVDYELGSVTVFGAVRFDLIADLSQSKIYGGVRLGR